MSDDPLDVMSFLKKKEGKDFDTTIDQDIPKAMFVDDVNNVNDEEGKGMDDFARVVRQRQSVQDFTPHDLPVDEDQVPGSGRLSGQGPVRRKLRPGDEVMFRMGPDGVPVDEFGNQAPVFNPKARCHLTVIDTVIHQLADESPVAVDSRYTRWLTTDDQHFSRQKRIGEKWELIHTEWVKTCGMLLIKNREGGRKLVNPSVEEIEKDNAKVLEVAVVYTEKQEYADFDCPVVFAQILPGESLRLQPVNLDSYRIRCRSGECKVSIDAFPE